jgi:tetratricopeptide (TPR) repeat protein
MSLIINMLKDLDKRETEKPIQPYIGGMNEKTDIFAWFSAKQDWLLGGILCLVFVIGTTLFFIHKHKTNLLALPSTNNLASPSVNPTPDAVNATWLKPASINGITLQVKDNITELTFSLDHAALYRLVSNNIENQLVLSIDHAQLQAELPAINFLNNAIQHISSQQVHGDTNITLTLVPGAELKYVNLSNEDKNPELVLAIEYQTNNANTTSDTTKAVKTTATQSVILQQYQVALNAAASGNYSTAITQLSDLLKFAPNYNDARVSLAALLLDQNDKLSAEKIVNAGLQLTPGYAPLVELKARMLTSEGQIKTALTLLQTAPPSIEENPDYYALIAALYEQSNNDNLAISLYRQLLTINPQQGNWWFGLGVSLDKERQLTDAKNAYTKAIALGHLSTDSLTYLQRRLHELGRTNNETE